MKYLYNKQSKTLRISGNGEMLNYNMETKSNFDQLDIRTIIIDEGVTHLGSFAFCNCNARNVIIPETVKTIGKFCFYNSKIKKVNLNKVSDIDEYAFANTDIKDIVFSPNLIQIKTGVFSGCSRLKKIEFPKTIKEIHSYAFYKCTGLTKLELSNIDVGNHAFGGCKLLNELKMQGEDIKPFTFKNCDINKLDLKVKRIMKSSFENNQNINIINADRNKLEIISRYAFRGCTLPRNFDFNANDNSKYKKH